MPIYEYQCAACGHQFETMQKFSDAPLQECPECHKPDLQKLVSSSAFHLKGGGWYVTDIRDKDKKKPEAAKPAAESKPEKTGSNDDKTSGSSSGSTDTATG